jgi:hypothetical protein
MAYYKVLIEVWCDWDPMKSDLKEIAGHVALREGVICTLQEAWWGSIQSGTETLYHRGAV